jgi:hypothetical protein
MSATGRHANTADYYLKAADRYLDAADGLLRGAPTSGAGFWPRACAWLLRLALEAAVNELWARERPEVVLVSMRARLLSLHGVRALEPTIPGRAEYLWAALSRTVHHHPYELSPTAAELRGWYQDVRTLADELRLSQPTRTRGDNPLA